ncbi:MAG: RDD family protein [Planctomycetaceae bacterium]
MPVKVRCPNCRKVLNAPDRARGKAVKCPSCESAIRVPAGEPAAGKKPARKAAAGPVDGIDDFANLDLRHTEDERARICPKCAADLSWLEEDETECPECGYDPTIAGLGARASKKRRKGPDPDEFWGAAWTDSWDFLKTNWKLALKMGGYWTAAAILCLSFLNVAAWCERMPPMFVWGAIGVVFGLGLPGLYWAVNNQVIQWTMDPRRKLDIQFDFFQNMTLGIKSLAWPWVLFFPLTAAAIGAAAAFGGMFADQMLYVQIVNFGSEAEVPAYVWHPQAMLAFQAAGIAVLSAYAISRLFFPLAQVHMTTRYTYKAWLPVDMLVVLFKNFAPAIYWCVMWLAVFLPLLAPAALFGLLWADGFETFVTDATAWLTLRLGGLMDLNFQLDTTSERPPFTVVPRPDIAGFMFYTVLGFSWLVMFTAVVLPAAMIAAFPALFMIRANGLLGHYFRESLGLVQERYADVPAGFWVRYLAFLADAFILLVMLLLLRLAAFFVMFVATIFGMRAEEVMMPLLVYGYGGLSSIIVVLYFSRQEADHAQGTMGKHGIGMIVTDLKGERITWKTGLARFFVSIIGFIAFPMVAFTEKKQALQDLLTKTLVVWKGDEASS